MRIWHKDLISVLPREQLVAQWRELSAIAGNILTKNSPNHILVNKIMDYPLSHFITYAKIVRDEMSSRGYKTSNKVWDKICSINQEKIEIVSKNNLFINWHNDRYLKQCYYNLEEKYDCGGIREGDFLKIKELI